MLVLCEERARLLEIEQTAEWIRRNGFKRIAIQVPDEMLSEAASISCALQQACEEKELQTQVFIMADTIGGSCHVDEITAQHLDAECVVHYGATYVPEVAHVPARFVLDKAPLDVDDVVAALSNHVEQGCDGATRITVTYELKYHHLMGEIEEKLRRRGFRGGASDGSPSRPNPSRCVAFARMQLLEQHSLPEGEASSAGDGNGGGLETCTHAVGGLTFSLEENSDGDGEAFVWIGDEGLCLTNLMLVCNRSSWFRYDPRGGAEAGLVSDVPSTSRALKRRYFLVEKAKDAAIVGIIVGSTSVAGFMTVLTNLRKMVAMAGKKCYTFVMSRVTPEKLANYPEVDVFVLVSYPQMALLDSKEFYAPVITPFEAELALVPGRQWTGQYRVDFAHLTTPIEANDDAGDCKPGDGDGDGAEAEAGPSYSLINGGYREQRPAKTNIITGGDDQAEQEQERLRKLQLSEGELSFARLRAALRPAKIP